MSSNPEQPNITPDAGDNPKDAGHLSGIPFDKEALGQRYTEDYVLDATELDAIAQTGQLPPLPDDREPARELPAPETQPQPNRKKVFAWVGGLAAGAAGIALAINSFAGATGGNPDDKDKPTGTQPVATAPVTPGGIAPVETPAPAETVKTGPRTVSQADIASYQENVESTVFTYGEHESAPAALPDFMDAFNKIINYQPSDEELENSKDLVSPVTGVTGPRAAAEKYRESFDGMFAKKGEFYQMLQATGASNFEKWLKTKEAGDAPENLYTMTFSLDEENRLVISSNVNKNSLPDDPLATVYTFSPNMKLVNPTPSNTEEDKRRWLWDEGILTKYGEVAKTD